MDVPEAHFLESWGDQRAPDGIYLPVQPMILPLFGGWSQLDLLAKLLSLPPVGTPFVTPSSPSLAAASSRKPGPLFSARGTLKIGLPGRERLVQY